MNLLKLVSTTDKEIFTQNILKDKASATLMQLKKGAVLREHQSMTNAMLILLSGKAVYEEAYRTENLSVAADFVRIPAHVTHKVTAGEDSVLVLIQ